MAPVSVSIQNMGKPALIDDATDPCSVNRNQFTKPVTLPPLPFGLGKMSESVSGSMNVRDAPTSIYHPLKRGCCDPLGSLGTGSKIHDISPERKTRLAKRTKNIPKYASLVVEERFMAHVISRACLRILVFRTKTLFTLDDSFLLSCIRPHPF
jgi:hypothetical protein